MSIPKFVTIISIVFINLSIIHGQDFQWVFPLNPEPDPSTIRYTNIDNQCIDNNGDMIVVGDFHGSVDFDPGAGVESYSSEQTAMFIAKYTLDGDMVWANGFYSSDYSHAYSVTTDNSGNIYVCGVFKDSVDFNPGAGNHFLVSDGLQDIYFAKYDSNGDFIWVKSLHNSGAQEARSIAYTADGNIVLFGGFVGTMDFNPGTGVANLISNGQGDFYMAKYTSSGSYIWAKSIGGTLDDGISKTVIDASDNIYIIGYFRDIVDMDPSGGVFNLISNGERDIFFAKYDNNGNFELAGSIGGPTYQEYGYGIDIDSDHNIYITGYFHDVVDFDPESSTFNLTSNGFADIFIAKYGADGSFQWAHNFGGSDLPYLYDIGYDLITDNEANVYITGDFNGIADFDPGSDTAFLDAGPYYYDIFLAKYKTTGEYIWAFDIGGTRWDKGKGLILDANNNLYLSCLTESEIIDFDPSEDTAYIYNPMTGPGWDEIACFAKYSPCYAPDLPTINATSTSICVGESTTISVSEGSLNSATLWYLYAGNCGDVFIANNETGVFTVSPTVTTTYFVRGEGGCTMLGDCTEITISVSAIPDEPTISANNPYICEGETCTLSVNNPQAGNTYFWSNGDIGESIDVNEAGSYSCYADNGVCQGNTSNVLEVFVTPIPDTPFISANGSVVFCDTESVALSVDSPQSGITYHWSNGEIGNSITINETGDYYCYGQDGECVGGNSNTITVIVHTTPDTPIITADDPALCEGETCNIAVESPQSGVSYYWSNGDTGNSISISEAGTYTCYGDSGDCQSENSNEIEVSVTPIPDTPTISANGPVVFCDTESVTLSVDSPQSGVSYHWSNGETGSSITVNETGDYFCYGQDNECIGDNSNIISVTVHSTPDTPVITADDPTLCEGEICTITVESPQSGVSYYWSNGDTGTSISISEAGSYFCYGDSGDCQSESSNEIDVTVTPIPNTPIISANGPIVFCDTESVTLSVDSPQSGVSYHWSNGEIGNSISVSETGDYFCYGQDGECVGGNSNTISVTVHTTPDMPIITADDPTLCEGEICNISVESPQSGVTYYWSNGDTGNSISISVAGTYSCYGDSGDCQSESSNEINVEVQEYPVAEFTSDLQGGTAPFEVQFSDLSTGSLTYWNWSFGDGGTSSEQNPIHTYNFSGLYTVSLEVETSFGCSDQIIKDDYIDVITSIEEDFTSSTVNIFPNPSKGELYVTFPKSTDDLVVSISNLFGQKLQQFQLEVDDRKTKMININHFTPGTYFITFYFQDQTIMRRFILL